MTDKEAIAMALDALETLMIERGSIYEKAIAALKERLTQTEQEPVAWLVEFENGEEELHFDEQSVGEIHTPLYTHSPQRKWLGLSPNELNMISDSMKTWNSFQITDVYFAIEAKLKEKNNA
jgi:phage FluMu protein gp41